MSVLWWMALIGVLLLFVALTSARVQRLPVSTAALYLAVGVVLGPAGVDLLRLEIDAHRGWVETLTEVAVIVSLFVGGLRLRLPLQHAAWRTALRLAGPVMLLSIVAIAAVAHLLLNLPLFAALLVGALLAPTDPVLAAEVAVQDAQDHDVVRFALSGEAGFNDGMAFPFVVFALEAMRFGGVGAWTVEWFAVRVLWAVPAGLAVGFGLGFGVGRFSMARRSEDRELGAPTDFLVLALIALAYVAAEGVGAWGFLSVFAAGVGLRRAEMRVVADTPHPSFRGARMPVPPRETDPHVPHPPAETLVPAAANLEAAHLDQPSIAAGVLIDEALTFGHTLERLLELLLVVLVGVALTTVWYTPAIAVAAALLFVIRPLATGLLLRRAPLTSGQRFLIGWFGIRGIGSLYYLAYALNHGLDGTLAVTAVQVVVTVVACSVVVHGITVTPLLARYERQLRA